MLHTKNRTIQRLLFDCGIGLEKENLRITGDGYFAGSPHPFDDEHIVRDFSENQVEVNTPVCSSVHEVHGLLLNYTKKIEKKLGELSPKEYIWPHSNPPYIRNEDDIPVAEYSGEEASKTEYRRYLAKRYGKYKMTFCGIHFNYSFSEELLECDYDIAKSDMTLRDYRDKFYVELAGQVLYYNWLVVALTAASPILDSSYFEKGEIKKSVFNGMSSTRCSELGYWNFFSPVLDYTDVVSYSQSIEAYITEKLIRTSSELYFPIRLKPKGTYDLSALMDEGVDHIELRMIDLNPLSDAGIDERDVRFLQLFLVYLASKPSIKIPNITEQVLSIQNTKNAARFDQETVSICMPQGTYMPLKEAGISVLLRMKAFYDGMEDVAEDASDIIDFEMKKLLDPQKRYANILREYYRESFVEKTLEDITGCSRR